MFTEDLSVFFDTVGGFAISGLLDGVAVRGIFDNAHALGAVGIGMASTQPTYTLPTTSVPPQPVGLTLALTTTSYLVAAHEPDGTGVSRLVLEVA